MSNFKWIDELSKSNCKEFSTPFRIAYDNEYLPELKAKLDRLIDAFKNAGLKKKYVDEITDYKNKIIESVKQYYKGDIVDAQTIINGIIGDFKEGPAISGILDSIALPSNRNEIQFFRARLSENVVNYPASEMLHIPFNKRSIVKSGRFSIPGLPCLYLGNSSYDCWIEMGCPADHRFNVSPVALDNTQRVLNLSVTLYDLFYLNNNMVFKSSTKEKNGWLLNMLKLILLTFSTSYKVEEQNRNFKSEYIISQMIMLACKSMGLDGITYYSKQVSDERFAYAVGVNLVLFADYSGNEGEELSSICEHIDIGDSFNFSMFKQLLPCQLYKEYDLSITHTPVIKNIGSVNRQIPYGETQFYEFDKYLFANWNKQKNSEHK